MARSKFAERLGVIVESGGRNLSPSGTSDGRRSRVSPDRRSIANDRRETERRPAVSRDPVAALSRAGEETERERERESSSRGADPLARGLRRPVLVGSSISKRISGHRALLCIFFLRFSSPPPPFGLHGSPRPLSTGASDNARCEIKRNLKGLLLSRSGPDSLPPRRRETLWLAAGKIRGNQREPAVYIRRHFRVYATRRGPRSKIYLFVLWEVRTKATLDDVPTRDTFTCGVYYHVSRSCVIARLRYQTRTDASSFENLFLITLYTDVHCKERCLNIWLVYRAIVCFSKYFICNLKTMCSYIHTLEIRPTLLDTFRPLQEQRMISLCQLLIPTFCVLLVQ